MVQFNLLPDVKLEYIKTKRTQHLVVFISVVAGAVAIAILLLSMFVVYFAQRKQIESLDKKISTTETAIKNTDDIERMLTVQNQLNSLTKLHEEKPVTSRLFGYLQQTTPQQINLSRLRLDYTSNTISIGGNADSLDAVKVYANALKAAGYSVDGGNLSAAFTDVVLSNFSRDDKGASFTINAKFAPDLFNSTKNVTMQVVTIPSGAQTPFEGGR